MAKVYEAAQLREFCLSVIGAEMKEVQQSEYWNTISEEERAELVDLAPRFLKIQKK